MSAANFLAKPDIKISVKQTFGLDTNMEVDAFSKKNEFVPKIDSHYKLLNKSGIQLRYVTTIPKILFNIYQYYNMNLKSEFSLLLYIGHLKTHVVLCSGSEILDSLDLPKGLYFFIKSIKQLSKNEIDAAENPKRPCTFYPFMDLKISIIN